MTEVRAGRRAVEITHPDKVLFPRDGITKLDLARYYAEVSATMLPLVRGRPLLLRRYVEGIDRPGFIQQDAGAGGPPWVARVETPRRGGGAIHHVVLHNRETLVYLANQGAIETHAWTSRESSLERPDRLVFDLDPPGEFEQARGAARSVRAMLEELGLRSWVMTTGSRGLHVVVPLRPEADHQAVRSFAREVSAALAAREPDALTVEQRLARREGRLYLDVGRNAYGQTAVAPYSVRARDGAPVAAPLDWEELDDPGLTARAWTLRTMPGRLADRGNPWAGIDRHRQSLRAPARRLAARSA
jgi:bifunctional non-homologous end joining protein LigD